MNEGLAAAVRSKVVGAATEAFKTFAEQRIAAIRERIGIPVQYDGGRIIRSLPGEAPRKEHGDLSRSVQATEPVFQDNVLDIFIFTDDIKAKWLEEGIEGQMAPRPFWEDSKTEVMQHADDLKALISENLGSRQSAAVSRK